jgi:hypothetical protein
VKLNKNQLTNISETLNDFKSLIPRYMQVKEDEDLLKRFCTRNRNPVWDISGSKFFDSGLISESSKKLNKKELVSDHYIQRTKAMKFIFDELIVNPDMSVNDFIFILKKYCSTLKISKKEHMIVTNFAKKNPNLLNYEIYDTCGIKIIGLDKLI